MSYWDQPFLTGQIVIERVPDAPRLTGLLNKDGEPIYWFPKRASIGFVNFEEEKPNADEAE